MSQALYEPPVTDQVAIVTGAGQGIGRAIALRLARDGMHVVVADLKIDQAEQVASEIRALGRRSFAFKIDVTQEEQRQQLLTTTLQDLGRLDVLVNNAGVNFFSSPLEVTEAHWDLVMNVNTKAVWFLCQAVLKIMIEQRHGRIVNLASIAGKISSTLHHPVYNVSKAGVIALTKTFAHAAAAHGVRVNCVCPGIIDTAMGDQVAAEVSKLTNKTPEQIANERTGRVPLGVQGTPAEVADVVSFLVGPDSRYMTGQAVNISGGMVMY